MDIEDFQMPLINFKASLLWASKFDDLRKSLETTKNSQTSILTCWKSLPEKFASLKKVANVLLFVFGSTYLCEQIFSHMKFILSSHHSRLTEVHSETCVQLKITRYSSNITELQEKARISISLKMTLVTAFSFVSLINFID